jgi:hypothetical protein
MLKGKANVKFHTVWVIGECDKGIVDYYRWWFTKVTSMKIFGSKHGAHISVVRGEEENIEPGTWVRDLSDRYVDFKYDQRIRCNKSYVWLNVESEEMEQIRMDVGLSPKPPFGLHLTIGRSELEIPKWVINKTLD